MTAHKNGGDASWRAYRPNLKPKKAEAQRESWWASYAVGERRDGEFMAEANRMVPKQTDSMPLQSWVGDVA